MAVYRKVDGLVTCMRADCLAVGLHGDQLQAQRSVTCVGEFYLSET